MESRSTELMYFAVSLWVLDFKRKIFQKKGRTRGVIEGYGKGVRKTLLLFIGPLEYKRDTGTSWRGTYCHCIFFSFHFLYFTLDREIILWHPHTLLIIMTITSSISVLPLAYRTCAYLFQHQ